MDSNTKDEALNALDNTFLVNFKEKYEIATDNGILNREYLTYQKRRLLKNAVTYLTDEVVKHKQDFPKNNTSEVTFTADFVVMNIEDFEKIEKLIETLQDE